MADINYNDDILDSRDLDERLEELEELEEALKDAISEFEDLSDDEDTPNSDLLAAEDACTRAREDFGDEERAELKMLQEARDEVGSEWSHGETLIADSYFIDYAEDMIKDIGDLPRELPGYIAIDWEATAENIKVDYSYLELDGNKFWYRMS